MTYEFQCDTCTKVQDINIPTYDIHIRNMHSLAIDKELLDKRLKEPRKCECGGNLRKLFANLGEPLYVEIDKHRFNPPTNLRKK